MCLPISLNLPKYNMFQKQQPGSASGMYYADCKKALEGFVENNQANRFCLRSDLNQLSPSLVKCRIPQEPTGLAPVFYIPIPVTDWLLHSRGRHAGKVPQESGIHRCGVRILHPDTSSVSCPSIKPVRNRYWDVKYGCQALSSLQDFVAIFLPTNGKQPVNLFMCED